MPQAWFDSIYIPGCIAVITELYQGSRGTKLLDVSNECQWNWRHAEQTISAVTKTGRCGHSIMWIRQESCGLMWLEHLSPGSNIWADLYSPPHGYDLQWVKNSKWIFYWKQDVGFWSQVSSFIRTILHISVEVEMACSAWQEQLGLHVDGLCAEAQTYRSLQCGSHSYSQSLHHVCHLVSSPISWYCFLMTPP